MCFASAATVKSGMVLSQKYNIKKTKQSHKIIKKYIDIYEVCFENKVFFFFFCKVILGYNGEGNGTPLQYSCLENPMDGGA